MMDAIKVKPDSDSETYSFCPYNEDKLFPKGPEHNICLLKDCAPTTDINLKQEVESVTESDGDAEDNPWDATDIKEEMEYEITTEDHEICTDSVELFTLQGNVYGSTNGFPTELVSLQELMNDTSYSSHNSDIINKNTDISVREENESNNLPELQTRPYKCRTCKKHFTTSSILKRHNVTHSDKKPYKCDLCDKSFHRKYHIIRHMRTHTGEKPYECEVCFNRFSAYSGLAVHRLTHTAQRPYNCDICAKGYCSRDSFRSHLLIHTAERPYVCNMCNKRFSNRGTLWQHRHIHTREGNWPKRNQSNYKCQTCNRYFTSKRNLTYHYSIHTGVKPYNCDLCKRKFRTRRTLVYHYISKRKVCKKITSYN